jgi:hypothetical protein
VVDFHTPQSISAFAEALREDAFAQRTPSGDDFLTVCAGGRLTQSELLRALVFLGHKNSAIIDLPIKDADVLRLCTAPGTGGTDMLEENN